MQTEVYRDFLRDFETIIEDSIRATLNNVPQDVGDIVTREQSIGELRIAKIAHGWFTEHVAATEQMISELTAQRDVSQQQTQQAI